MVTIVKPWSEHREAAPTPALKHLTALLTHRRFQPHVRTIQVDDLSATNKPIQQCQLFIAVAHDLGFGGEIVLAECFTRFSDRRVCGTAVGLDGPV